MIKRPIFLAVVLLIATSVAVGYQAFELNKERLKKVTPMKEPVRSKQEQAIAAANVIPNLAQLAKQNLMGNPIKPVTVPVKAISDTTLKLTLIGTITKTEGGQGSALIQGSNRETKRYFIGEMIEGGVALDSVAVDSVVLKRNGVLEILRYPRNPSGGASNPASNAAAGAPPSPNLLRQAVDAQPPQQQNNSSSNEKPENKRLLSLRERLKAQANKKQPNLADKEQESN